MPRFKTAVILAAAFLLAVSSFCAADDVDNIDTGASLGGFFIESITGQSPAALGLASDGAQVIRIGEAVAGGDYIGAVTLTAELAGNRVIASVPVLGQAKMLADVGRWFGNYMYKVMGDRNFTAMYRELSDYPADTWPSSYQDLSGGMYPVFRAHFQGLARDYAGQVLHDAGYDGKITDPEAERIVFKAFLERARFERACDSAGLRGKKRTPENLKTALEENMAIDAGIAAEEAREMEKLRLQAIAAEADKEENPEPVDIEAEVAQEMEAMEQQQTAQEEQPSPEPTDTVTPVPDDAVVVAQDKPQDAQPPQNGQTGEAENETAETESVTMITWTVSAAPDDDQTVFTVTVTNESPRAVNGFSCSAEPVGDYESGGVGWGSSPSFDTIEPGQSIDFTALAMGDVDGIVLSFFTEEGAAGSETVLSVHKTTHHADGTYRGSFNGEGISGAITITINGTSVTGRLDGAYSDPDQNISNSASIEGSFDPDTGSIIAQWSGTAVGTIVYRGEKRKVNEPIAGTIRGAFSRSFLAGDWSGGSAYISTSGSWSAQ